MYVRIYIHIDVCADLQEEKMSWTVADAVDYKGFPADKSRTGGWVAAALILGIIHLSTFLSHDS